MTQSSPEQQEQEKLFLMALLSEVSGGAPVMKFRPTDGMKVTVESTCDCKECDSFREVYPPRVQRVTCSVHDELRSKQKLFPAHLGMQKGGSYRPIGVKMLVEITHNDPDFMLKAGEVYEAEPFPSAAAGTVVLTRKETTKTDMYLPYPSDKVQEVVAVYFTQKQLRVVTKLQKERQRKIEQSPVSAVKTLENCYILENKLKGARV